MGLFDKLLKEGKEALKEVTSEENKQKASAILNSLKETAKEGAETLKEAAKEAASEENREKASAFLNSLKDTLQEQAQEFKKTAEEMKAESRRETPAYSETAFEAPEDGKTCRERILDILAAEFPQYTVREDVSPQTIGGTGRFMNYSIAVYSGDTPKLFIMLVGKTTTSHREYRWSREEAEKNGYAFINFVKHYPNTPEYVSKRLHQYL